MFNFPGILWSPHFGKQGVSEHRAVGVPGEDFKQWPKGSVNRGRSRYPSLVKVDG
jgi:hypothetical protein